MPPHDLEAETSVLGAILLDQGAITRILDFLSAEDFYRENNGQVYRAALTLFREGEPIDNVTLASELEKMGVLERVGGRGHLALLQESVPTAANVEHYAKIVKAKAYKRRLITAGGQVTALGFDDGLDADEAVNQAQSHVYAISEDRVGSGMERLYDLLKPAMDRIDAQMASGGGVIGVPTGFHDLDRMTNGFKPADLVIIAGRPSMGKALALDTPIPTPDGWRTMGRLRVGDQVFDERGVPCTVTYATPVQERRDCYAVTFSDGARIVADGDHLWSVLGRSARRSGGDRRPTVMTTCELLGSVRTADGRPNYAVPACEPLQYPPAVLEVDPYDLAAWLGDSRQAWARLTPNERRLIADLQRDLPSPGPERPAASAEAVREQRIPRPYLEASIEQRLALLQGLMDRDGSIDRRGHAVYVSRTRALAESVRELLTGLGFTSRLAMDSPGPAGQDRRPRYRVRFEPAGVPVFRHPEHIARQHATAHPARPRQRLVAAIEPVPSVPVRCIQVDSPSHLYLAGRDCVPTHNTSFVLNVALHAAVGQQKPIAIFSLEMSKEQLVERMLCEQARIDAQRLHRGTLSDVEYERLAGALGPLGDAPIYIDDSPMLDDLTMRLKARQARSREGIEMIVLDYLQLMHGRSQGGDANRVQEVSAISRSLKGIARELKIPIIAISQLSRAPEARPDKRPILSDLRESGSIEQDADIVMFLYRDEYYNRDKTEKPGIAEIIVAKHRNGPTGMVELMFRKELTRFENLERRRPESAGPE
jgi:replicative DNA helicase